MGVILAGMKYMGIDYGEKRVGIAISDDEGRLSFPHSVLENNSEIIGLLEKMCKDGHITGIVIGESRDFKGKPNTILKDSVVFAEKLKQKIKLPIFFEPEFLTSKQASHIQGDSMLDASAASIILESFLNKKN